MTFSLSFGKDDEFEDEPEDELASSGMHVVEDGEDDDEEKPIKEDELDGDVLAIIDAVEGADEAEAVDDDLAPDGLEELDELEKELNNEPLTFGDTDAD
jgi:hypothetical protein